MLFDGSAGQVVSLAETNDTYACNVFSFSILKPDGTTLDWTNTCGSASLSSETLPTTGTYTVFVNPGSTGSATFTLSQNITQAIAFNTPQTVSSTLAGQVFDLTFSGTAGQVVSLAMTNPSYACNVFSFSILKPDGTRLDSVVTCGNASLSSETLPVTGTYTVYVYPGWSSGGATFTLTQNITQVIAFNTPQTVSSTLAGQVFDLTFSGTAGQVVSVAMTNPSYACNVFAFSILKPDGTRLDSVVTCGNASLSSETLPVTGTYTVYVYPGWSSGGATFTLTQNITQAIAFNTPKAVSSTLAGQVFDLTFSGTAGQVVSLAETNDSYACNVFSFSILKPDGTTLAWTNTCGNASLSGQTLPVTGTYTVYVNPVWSSGGATFTLTSP